MKSLRIYLMSTDVGSIDKATIDIVDMMKKVHTKFIGPIPLSCGISIPGKSLNRRLIDIENPDSLCISSLAELNLPVSVEVKMRYL